MSVRSGLTSIMSIYDPEWAARFGGYRPGSAAYNQSYYGYYRDAFNQSLAREIPGTLDLAGFNAAKAYELKRLEERNVQAEKFAEQSQTYSAQMMQQQQAAESFASRLADINTRLGGIRQAASTAASPASSEREYSQLAKRAMQGTSRYLQELEAFRSPQAPEISFGFKDPITGKDLELGTKFEDIYSSDFDPSQAARQQVMEDFTRIRDERRQEALDLLYQEFGRPEDYGDFYSYDYNIPTESDSQAKQLAYQQYQRSLDAQRLATDYAEASALAELGGYTENISTQPYWLQNTLEFDPSALFYQANVNQVLEDYISKTTERLDLARLGDRAAVEEEFNRRKQLAESQFSLYNRQQQRNKEQEQRIEEEKQRVRQLMEQQKREYSQTLSSFGDTTSVSGEAIRFTDTRPQ